MNSDTFFKKNDFSLAHSDFFFQSVCEIFATNTETLGLNNSFHQEFLKTW